MPVAVANSQTKMCSFFFIIMIVLFVNPVDKTFGKLKIFPRFSVDDDAGCYIRIDDDDYDYCETVLFSCF